jgi:RNA polymerase sigma factor (sigma-70 family)
MTEASEATLDLAGLVRLAAGGDANAFSVLVDRYCDAALAQALVFVPDLHLAQDVVQESFVAAYLSLPRLQEPAAFGGWLRSIVRHQSHRVLRKLDHEFAPLDEAAQSWTDQVGPETCAADREKGHILLSLVDRLPSPEREAISLFYLHECSRRDVAAFLNLPITTVDNRLHSARLKLKEELSTMVANTLSQHPIVPRPELIVGTVMSVDGPLIDVRFEARQVPDLFDALVIADAAGKAVERMKVMQRRDAGLVRCVATGQIQDVAAGMKVMNTGAVGVALTPFVGVSPVSDGDLERVVARLSGGGAKRLIETGIKPIDLFCPLLTDGNVALSGMQGVGRIVLLEELLHRLGRATTPIHLNVFYLVDRQEPDSVRGMLTQEKDYPGDVVGGVQTFWILSNRATDAEYAANCSAFDAAIDASILLAIDGLYPAVDPLHSRSNVPNTELGDEHMTVARMAIEILRQAKELMVDPVLLELIACRNRDRAVVRSREFAKTRMNQLNPADRLIVSRARKLQRFMTTPFFVVEPYARRPGKFVPRIETIRGCRMILEGQLDAVPEERLLYVGVVEEALIPPPST